MIPAVFTPETYRVTHHENGQYVRISASIIPDRKFRHAAGIAPLACSLPHSRASATPLVDVSNALAMPDVFDFGSLSSTAVLD